MTNLPLFSVVIPAFNEGAWLKKTVLGVLENTDYPDFEIIIVDDGSTDDSALFLSQDRIPNTQCFRFEESQGAIIARNKGAEIARGEYLVFIDGHQIPLTPNWLQVLADTLKSESVGAAMVPIVSMDNHDLIGHVYGVKDFGLEPTWHTNKDSTPFLVPAIAGGCFAIRQALFKQTEGFNRFLKKWGREDLEYSLRLWFLGYDLLTVPLAQMAHEFGHNRQFEISWNEVDLNTCLIADLFFPQSVQDRIFDHLELARLGTTQTQLDRLAANLEYQKFKQKWQPQFVRTAAEYSAVFEDYLPADLFD